MTRLEAIKAVRRGHRLTKIFRPEWDGVDSELEVWVEYEKICTGFPHRKVVHHTSIGPVHVRFWSGSWPHWIHITPRQLLGFIRRNYVR